MRGRKNIVTLAMFVTLLLTQAHAVSRRVIHHFNNNQGSNPEGVVVGPDGNLYGATCGDTVFELTRDSAGRWQQTKTYNTDNLQQGCPNGNLIFDSAGNIYGTTFGGFASVCGCCICGNTGSVFELSPISGSQGWHETTIIEFYATGDAMTGTSEPKGKGTDVIYDSTIMYPVSGLTRDSEGNLYGAAEGAQESLSGAVFKLSPTAGGGWTLEDGPFGEHTLAGPVTIDTSGSLYGTGIGLNGGPLGTVWKIDASGALTTLYTFTDTKNGNNPLSQGGLVLDRAGNFYGTTQFGGQFDQGTVFELIPNADGTWAEKVLHSFDGARGGHPTAGVIFDAAGNLYGEAYDGGDGKSGVVFKLTPTSGGHWTYTPLRSFHGPDGSGPSYGLTSDSSGNLYGTTWTGGAYGNGTVFEITP